jgi:hypothetical protein
MTGRLRRALVLAIVVGLVAQSAVAPAMAAPDDDGAFGDECGRSLGELTVDVLTGKLDKSSKCEAMELVANTTWADTYASGLAQSDLGQAGRTPISNHLEDSKTYARTIVKTEAVRAFNNDTLTKAEIKDRVNQSVEDYYATMQKNLERTYRANVNQAWYAYKAREQAGLNEGVLAVQHHYDTPIEDSTQSDTLRNWFNSSDGTYTYKKTTVNVTLVNGETIETTSVKALVNDYTMYTSPANQSIPDPDLNPGTLAMYAGDPDANWANPVDAYNYNTTNSIEIYDGYDYRTLWADINSTADGVKANGDQYVDSLFTTYNRSEGVNVTEVLSPNDLASQWNTEYESTGQYGWMAAQLGLTDLQGNVSSSFEIEYTPRSNHTPTSLGLGGNETTYAFTSGTTANLSGTLMTDWAPTSTNGAFVQGSTYDTADATAPVLFIEQVNSTESRVVELDGTFTVTSMTNVQTGDSVNETTLDEQTQQTWNVSSTEDELNGLLDYRQDSIDSYQTSSTGGVTTTAPSGLLDDLRNWFDTALTGAWVGLIALAGAGLLILRILSG